MGAWAEDRWEEGNWREVRARRERGGAPPAMRALSGRRGRAPRCLGLMGWGIKTPEGLHHGLHDDETFCALTIDCNAAFSAYAPDLRRFASGYTIEGRTRRARMGTGPSPETHAGFSVEGPWDVLDRCRGVVEQAEPVPPVLRTAMRGYYVSIFIIQFARGAGSAKPSAGCFGFDFILKSRL